MQQFHPAHIFIDEAVIDLPLTRRVCDHFSAVPRSVINGRDEIKKPIDISEAKKQILITRHEGEAVKACQGRGDYVCCNYLTVSFVSNCHLECTYCILQDYLKNNPMITFFANVDEILQSIHHHISQHPEQLYRLGTGELSDSLALDAITGFSKELVPFAANHKNLILELKTKTNQIDNLLSLDHQGRTVISWSVNPQEYIRQEELKCSSLDERLEAAQRCIEAGYRIGFHFDPLISSPQWQEFYEKLVDKIRQKIEAKSIAWISLGSLRFTPGLKPIVMERFPKSQIMTGELFPSKDGKMRYFREIREEMYTFVKKYIDKAFSGVPNYLCMETADVWEETFGQVPLNRNALEKQLVERFVV